MPPKAKITKEMIVDAAFSIVRQSGVDKITARRISEELKCSTQPILYHFSSVEEIKRAAYEKADAYHSEYILNMENMQDNPMFTIGINYIRFAIEESNLFRFLFQTDEFSGTGMLELLDTEEMLPVISVFQQEMDISLDAAKEIFATLFIFAHGYASLHANNAMKYDEQLVAAMLTKIFYGAVYAAEEVTDEEVV